VKTAKLATSEAHKVFFESIPYLYRAIEQLWKLLVSIIAVNGSHGVQVFNTRPPCPIDRLIYVKHICSLFCAPPGIEWYDRRRPVGVATMTTVYWGGRKVGFNNTPPVRPEIQYCRHTAGGGAMTWTVATPCGQINEALLSVCGRRDVIVRRRYSLQAPRWDSPVEVCAATYQGPSSPSSLYLFIKTITGTPQAVALGGYWHRQFSPQYVELITCTVYSI